jgi:pimeloyl-ACP methyl ester carboxylesterase
MYRDLIPRLLAFVDALELERFAMMVFDYGAPVGFRLAAAHPRRIAAIITQNGNAYEEGAPDVQLDLFGDYKSNLALYPRWHEYLRTVRPPLLAVWGKGDPFFSPAGAHAFRNDVPDAEIHLFDTGHFALETDGPEIATLIRAFLSSSGIETQRRRG